MNKLIDVLFPKVSIDEVLFRKAPTETLRVFVKQLQSRLNRLEVIVVIATITPYLPLDKIGAMI